MALKIIDPPVNTRTLRGTVKDYADWLQVNDLRLIGPILRYLVLKGHAQVEDSFENSDGTIHTGKPIRIYTMTEDKFANIK